MSSAARLEAAEDLRHPQEPALRLRIGIQGEAGSFSESAVRSLPDLAGEAVPFADFAGVLEALEAGEVDRALLPVHNSLVGVVGASLRAIAEHDLRVEAEVEVPVRLFLLGLPGSSLATVQAAASHPVALAQCSRFFLHHPAIHAVAEHDTAGAARLVAERLDPAVAAIASREAGERHGLVILASEIQDRTDNATRFWLLARRRLAPHSAEGLTAHVTRHLRAAHGVRAVRGATTTESDTAEAMKEAVRELLDAMLEANQLRLEDVVSAIFTATPDLTSEFPAVAAREAGWGKIPLLCTAEIGVPRALPRCLRVLLHVTPRHLEQVARHVYLREARVLRPDLNS